MATATRAQLLAPALNGSTAHVDAQPAAPTSRLIHLSPMMAASLLEGAHANRKISGSRVRQLTRAMQSGRWEVNGQGLVLCDEGRLLDGRHRCSAVIASGITIKTMVCCGVNPSVLTLDAGKRRSGGDVLAISGHKQSELLASSLRWCWRYENVEMLRTAIPLEDYELVAYLDQHKPIITSLTWGSTLKSLIPSGAASMMHYFMHGKDPALAKTLFRGLASGLELTASDPIWTVRERYIAQGRAMSHASITERCAAVVRCWQTMRTGRPMPQGKFVGGSAQFPRIE